MSQNPTDQTDEQILIQKIQRIITDRFGLQSKLVRFERSRFPFIGSYDCDLVTAHLSTGEHYRLFLKDYRVSQKSKDEPQQRRERELRVYRDLLLHADLGTPEYHGSVWDDSEGRFWIFLEFVDGIVIRQRDVEYGIQAAEWLGRMQGYFAKNREFLSSASFLIRQDGEYFRSKAALALWNVGQVSPASAKRLKILIDGYDQIVEFLEVQPLTLVHGAYIPWHILLDLNHEPNRVCPVDWELAAVGSTLYDLAYFTDGMVTQSCDLIFDAYRRAAMRYDVPVSGPAEMQAIVDGLRLHRLFDWLSRAVEKRYTATKVARLVDLAEQLRMQIPV